MSDVCFIWKESEKKAELQVEDEQLTVLRSADFWFHRAATVS